MTEVSSSPKPRLLVALSGGVDSAVAAWRLQQAGHPIEAAYMKNWINEEQVFGNCPWMQDIEDARAVCDHLGVPFQVINFMDAYRERVVSYLVDGYAKGLTPNPDVMCNREMKFGVLLDWALENGFDGVATGHYARRKGDRIFEGVDKNKDQSYFLALLRPDQRDRAWFPVGDLTKPELRDLAESIGLPNAEKKDSQGICFIGEVKINDFLEKFIEDRPGDIVNPEGRKLGEHRGLHRYTLGQRRGIGIPSNADNEFYVVIGKNLEANELVVAFESSKPDAIWAESATVRHLSWVSPEPPWDGERLHAKVRYRDRSVPMTFSYRDDRAAEIRFDEAQRALAEGQVCAFYRGEELLGGGVYL
ncbi:MAG: tRNA 2-thiouridine(34) synthase MnmA [Opitutales bacterium]|nr:tRNA 2-thiouridine(34) synthase MnmA [Opitutales bacterium]